MLALALPVAVAVPAAAALPAAPASPEDFQSYLVQLQPDAAPAERVAAHTRLGGVRLKHLYSSAVNGFAADLTPAALGRLRNDPAVAALERDDVVTTATTQQNPPWNLDRIDQRTQVLDKAFTPPGAGSGVTVYVLDTGIRASHHEFGGRVQAGFDAFDGDSSDCNGHGTHVAGTVGARTYGVAKDVRIVAVRVLPCSGYGTTSDVVAGIDWVTQHHKSGTPAVANMSLISVASPVMDAAVRTSIADGVVYTLGAGNAGIDACRQSPARVTEGITVSATDKQDVKHDWANFGPCVDVFAPGVAILSAWHTSDIEIRGLLGTSMSAPHVAGVAALYLAAHPTATPAEVQERVLSYATPGVVLFPGAGSPNRLLHSGFSDVVSDVADAL